MKRIGLGVFLLALSGMGCIDLHLPLIGPDKKPEATESVRVAEPKPVAPAVVVPDQVTETNAAQKAKDLRAELEYATAQEQAAPAPAAEKPKK